MIEHSTATKADDSGLFASLTKLFSSVGGGELNGKYSSENDLLSGLFEIEFKSGNKADVGGSLSPTIEVDYEVSGKEVKIKNPQGTMVATITDDGCLDFGGVLGKLCKQTKNEAELRSERRCEQAAFRIGGLFRIRRLV